MMGRPTKLTQEIKENICKALLAGNHFSTSCQYAGVDTKTAQDWLLRGEGRIPGRPASPLYVDFAVAVRKAETDAEVRTVANWQNAIPNNWQAARDFLARRYPKRWQEKKRIELADLTPEQIMQLLLEEGDTPGDDTTEGEE